MAADGPDAIRHALAHCALGPPSSRRPPGAEAADIDAVRTSPIPLRVIQWLLLFAFFLSDLVAAAIVNLFMLAVGAAFFKLPDAPSWKSFNLLHLVSPWTLELLLVTVVCG